MASLALGVRFTPAAGGTTDFVYASTVTGYRVATSVLVNSKVYRYRAESADLSQWEYGTAIWSSTTSTLSRNTITDSSNSGAKVNFTVAPQVAITIDVPDVLGFDDAMSLTTAQKKQAQSNIFVGPTMQILTSGTAATYTTPAGCTWIEVWICGAGGGGAGSSNGTTGQVFAGSVGGTSTFNSVSAIGGSGAGATATNPGVSQGGAGGTGGTGTATFRQPGSPGANGFITSASMPVAAGGGSSFCGGGAQPLGFTQANGNSASANSGAGGGGAFGGTSTDVMGGGGGGGEMAYLIINSPSATYTYTIGVGGAGGIGAAFTGGAGGSGVIRVIEHYGS